MTGADAVRAAFGRVLAAAADATAGPDVEVLVEAMAEPGVELFVAARRDAVVPTLVVGLGGIWTELLDDVAIVPLPADRAARRACPALAARRRLLTGARGGAAVDLPALAAFVAAAGELLLAEGLELLELNPVIATPAGPSPSTRRRAAGSDR